MGSKINTRRTLLRAIIAGVALAPLGVRAQAQPRHIGFLALRSRQSSLDSDIYGAFMRGMTELGYAEGKNFVIEGRYADGKPEGLESFAGELTRLNVDVIITDGVPATHAAQRVTKSIPIVAGNVADPVGQGFAASFARPGGNVTGLSSGVSEFVTKHLELLMTAAPGLSRVAVLSHPGNDAHPALLKSIQAAAKKVSVTVLPINARTPEEIERHFVTLTRERAGAIIILADSYFTQQGRQTAELAIKHRMPSIYTIRDYPGAGGFMSYGPNVTDNFRRAAAFVDKIFKGAKPGELPFEMPTRFYLVINRKTAKALGLNITNELLLRADEVIE